MRLFCSLFLIFIGIVGLGFQFVAVSMIGVGVLDVMEAIWSFGLGIPFVFCIGLIVIGCICALVTLCQKTDQNKSQQ